MLKTLESMICYEIEYTHNKKLAKFASLIILQDHFKASEKIAKIMVSFQTG